MAKFQIQQGATSQLLQIFIQNNSATDGRGLTNLDNHLASVTTYYYREGAGSVVEVPITTGSLGTYATNMLVEMSESNMPGWYQFGIPDAALAAGAKSVGISFQGQDKMAPVNAEIQLTQVNFNDSVTGGMSRITSIRDTQVARLDTAVSTRTTVGDVTVYVTG